MTDTPLNLPSKETSNSYYYIIFIDTFDKNKIEEVLNYNAPIGFCSLVYKPEYNYSFNELLEYVKSIDKKYPWKLHEITLPQYPFTLFGVEIFFGKAISKSRWIPEIISGGSRERIEVVAGAG